MAKPEYTELYLSEEVAVDDEVTLSMIPTAGRYVTVKPAHVSAPGQDDAVIRIIWDFGGAEETLWPHKHAQLSPTIRIDKSKIDGVKKLAIVMGNSHISAMYMGILVQVKEHDNDG